MNFKMIKIHEDVHKIIKESADRLGMSIIDYVRFMAYTMKKKGKQ